MKLKELDMVVDVGIGIKGEYKKFIASWHYSNTSPRGCKYIFTLRDGNRVIGLGAIGIPVGANVQKSYEREYGNKIYELKRLCLIDDTPRNAESFFIGKILRWINKETDITSIISYADPTYGHKGVIYKASNFKYLGEQGRDTFMYAHNGTIYHSRNVFGKNTKTAKILKSAMEKGEVEKIKLGRKHIYMYSLR